MLKGGSTLVLFCYDNALSELSSDYSLHGMPVKRLHYTNTVIQQLQVCEHCSYRNAKEYQWQNKTIILAADYASNGIYNFIIPLRAHFKSKTSLNPIILLLERRPDVAFLDAISFFPLVYWMLGSIDCLDDLLRAGITLAENVVVVNKELSNSAEEDSLSDCNTIVAVQTMFK